MKKFTIEQIENIIKELFLNAKLLAPAEIDFLAELSGRKEKVTNYWITIYQHERKDGEAIKHRFSASSVDELKKLLKQSIEFKNI